jgi:uracil-DNA glycosylase
MTTTSTPPPTLPSPTNVKLVRGVFPKGAKLLIVGEAPGTDDEKFLSPFQGAAGSELTAMLSDAGMERASVALTLTFNTRPPLNNILNWTLPKKEITYDNSRPWAWVSPEPTKYLRAEILQPALERLRDEILLCRPNVIVAAGNVAFGALCGATGIGRVRGTLHESTLVPGIKVIPTYSPSAILKQYDNRFVVVTDLMKAKAEAEFPEFRFLRRALYLEPTIADLFVWRDRLLACPRLAFDIETIPALGQITCIGFACSATEAYVIPFWDRRNAGGHYWPTIEDEVIAWKITREILSSPSTKIAQNGLYDVQYCTEYNWLVRGYTEDTMILHHSLYPSIPKGLDFLGSIYCNERAWKKYRPRGGEEKDNA